MGVFSALVLFAMIWFVTLLVVLVIRQPSQAETGQVVRGTHAGAPADPQLKRRVVITTAISFMFWVPLVWIIASGRFTIEDIDVIRRLIDTHGSGS